MAEAKGATVSLRGVSKRFGALEVLHPTTLELGPGINVLLGPSGSGKSTLLRLMTGLARPDAGEVLLNGQPLTPEALVPWRRRMGYVIQDGGLFPHLTAAGNATLAARYFGWEPTRTKRRLEELTALTRLPPECLARFPAQLSGGQRQRVSLMRALMLEPELILLDEPLGALDPLIRAELRTDLKGIFRTLPCTVVLVTHDLAEAQHFADRVVLMRDGGVVQEGTLRQLMDAPADPFVTLFIGAQRPSA